MATVKSRNRIFQQIEVDAGLNPPITYTQLLTFYGDHTIDADPASGQFIPMTQVRNRKRGDGAILFAVGVLPPSIRVTERLLDRSATIANLGEDIPTVARAFPPPTGGKIPLSELKATDSAGSMANHRAFRPIIVKALRKILGREPTLGEIQYGQAVGAHEGGYGLSKYGGKVINNWGAVHCTKRQEADPNVQCHAFQDTLPNGKVYEQSFRIYDTPEEGAEDMLRKAFIHAATSKGVNGDDASVMRGSYLMRNGLYFGGFCPKAVKKFGPRDTGLVSFSEPYKNEATQACAKEATEDHARIIQKRMHSIAVANKDPWSLALGTYEDAENEFKDRYGHGIAHVNTSDGGPIASDEDIAEFFQQGKKSADEILKEWQKLDGTRLNYTDKGKKLSAAQAAQAKALKAAIEAMENTPPLKMLVNPKEFSVKGEKIVQDGNWGRNGPIIEHWGDNQDKISASGQVAGFFAMDTRNAGGPGLTRYARNLSEGWKNFQSAFLFYKNNGAVYLPEFLPNGKLGQQNLTVLGSVYIYYDNILYIGSFDNFNISEDDTKPFTASYSFEFTVRSAFVLDRTNEEFTYGAPSLFSSGAPGVTASTPTTNQTPTANVAGQEVTPRSIVDRIGLQEATARAQAIANQRNNGGGT